MSNEVPQATRPPGGGDRFATLLRQHKAITENANRRNTALTYGPLFLYSLLFVVAFAVYPLADALLHLWGVFVK
jgi:hypothetical protein